MTYSILLSGCGGAGMYVAQVAERSGRTRVAALFDPSGEQLAAARTRYPDAVTGDDLGSLIADVRPDIVAVAGPDHLHADQTVQALEHGAHTLVEKPLATTMADARRIMDAADRKGLTVMTDHTSRYMYPWQEMSRAARSGEIGEIFFIQGDYIHDMWSIYHPGERRHTPWRIDDRNPQNILLGGGCHPIDNILSTVDSPVVEVFAYSSKMSVPEFPADDCYILMLKFENGVMGKVFVSSGCSGHGMGGGMLAVYGTAGTLWNGKLYRRGEEPVSLPNVSDEAAVGGHGWGRSVIDFLDTLDGRIENPIPARMGARVVAVCEAGLESVRTGRPQKPEWP
ncbi:MAG: Gfo/Idh/MocA family oxidoreductase [Gemmatimonadetes bacterium]|nr:Gfo/Idh/MocA family oxidoreductase [Gemmatimonadota bacterium]MYG83865.1 Gfo/Idh/MocA family oxidoreductase [Gemmatimonadota bacterium]MYJ90696.1 Gfo/Idh/MocA family oxidoreductase [Gemmatimonadota bacterium]